MNTSIYIAPIRQRSQRR